MIVCYFGTYRKEYSRNKIMMAALRSAGVEVKECHVSLWHGIEDRVNVTLGGWQSPKFWWRVVKAYSKLLWKYQKIGDYDILMVGYPGQVDVFLARFLANIKKKPLVWDVFMSIYLIAIERKLGQKKHSSVKLIRGIEARALRKPDLLIQDTAEYVKWFQKEYGIRPEQFKLVPTGADDRIFKPLPEVNNSDGLFHVLYYGTFIPNHGVMHIVKAAQLLKDEHEIIFDMIGDGPERKAAEEFVKSNELKNVRFYDWMTQENLLDHINISDVCLGAFGDTPQSLMTVQNKIYECMAVGKAVITGDSSAIRAEFIDKEQLIISTRNSTAISNSIVLIKNDSKLYNRISNQTLIYYHENFSILKLGKRLVSYLQQLNSN